MITINYGLGAFPNVSLGADTFICSGSQFVLQPGTFSEYQWQDNSTDSFYIVKYDGNYSVQIRNSYGCPASDTLFVKEDCVNDIIVPNAFTPNGDAVNEIFRVSGSETSTFKIYIYDRWGQEIFKSDDRDLGWDGNSRGRLVQEGFYNYIINYSIHDDERTKKGSIFVFR